MNLFIDTNRLLDFSQISSGELEDISKLVLLSEDKKVTLLVYGPAKNEFLWNCKANCVFAKLLDSSLIPEVGGDIIVRAMRHVSLRQLSGKRGSNSDEILWEWLLHNVSYGEGLHLISQNGFFESATCKGTFSNYLYREWSLRKKSQCTLYCSIAEFLKAHFDDVDLTDKIARRIAMDRLKPSPQPCDNA